MMQNSLRNEFNTVIQVKEWEQNKTKPTLTRSRTVKAPKGLVQLNTGRRLKLQPLENIQEPEIIERANFA